MQDPGFHGNETKTILKFFFSQTGWSIFKYSCRNVTCVTLYQIPSNHVDLSKDMAAKRRNFFALYDYSRNLNNLLLRKCMADFQIIV